MTSSLLPSQLLVWLGLAVLAQVQVAWFGIASRWLQTKTTPPIPALRLLLVVSLMAIGFLMLLDALAAAGRALQRCWRRRQQQRQQQQQQQQRRQQQLGRDAEAGGPQAAASDDGPKPGSNSTSSSHSAEPACKGDDAAAAAPAAGAADAASGAAAEEGAAADEADEELQRPDVPGLRRGLSRKLAGSLAGFEARHPRAYRALAATIIATSMALAGGCQLVAPGFVDAAIVQLINSFGVLLVVLVQAALLGMRLPWLVWPCSAAMTGGAVMIVVPAIGSSSNGGLNSGRAWLGFGLSVVACLAATAMYITLQAFRRLRFTGRMLQYLYLSLTIVVALPLTLAIDGTDWAEQFGGWDGGDWALLVTGATVIYVMQNFLLQHTTWKLGAPLVSMFYGLRLVASIVLSKLVLSYTVIRTAVQIAGAVITVLSVTVYAGKQYWSSRQEAAAKAAGDASSRSGSTAANK